MTSPISSTKHRRAASSLFGNWPLFNRRFWQKFIKVALNPYRPEVHYMRGPGPACMRARSEIEQARAKQTDGRQT